MITRVPIALVSIENDGFHLFVKARINGKYSANLILDTGASRTVFDLGLLKGITTEIPMPKEIQTSGIGDQMLDTQLAVIRRIRIGDLVIRDLSTVLLDLTHINNLYRNIGNRMKIWGLLGGDFFITYHARIDYKNMVLALENH
jgi:hypothetical protein